MPRIGMLKKTDGEMWDTMRKKIIGVLTAMLLLSGCGAAEVPMPAETIDPYAGMVQVDSGMGTQMWVREYEDVPRNPLRDAVLTEAPILGEDGQSYTPRFGVDVSEHQGKIDWAALCEKTVIDFAILRVGYRGYGTEGKLMEDAFFAENLRGAYENGLDIGVYFFSQAATTAEAEEEADFLIGILRGYAPEKLALPVFFDWERIDFDTARTDNVTDEMMTDCAIAFCERVRTAGYTAGVYTFRFPAYFSYDLSRIKDYPLWIGAVGEASDFYYAFDIWQYSTQGLLPGVDGNIDLDVIFTPVQSAEPPQEAAPPDREALLTADK